jgi:hypothetical protein
MKTIEHYTIYFLLLTLIYAAVFYDWAKDLLTEAWGKIKMWDDNYEARRN